MKALLSEKGRKHLVSYWQRNRVHIKSGEVFLSIKIEIKSGEVFLSIKIEILKFFILLVCLEKVSRVVRNAT